MASASHDSVSIHSELSPALADDIGSIGVTSDSCVGREQSLEAQQPVEANDTAFAGVPCNEKTKVSRTYEIKGYC
jgi:hypothetical protein